MTIEMDAPLSPFAVDAEAEAWVESTLARMTTRQKLGQLLCLYLRSDDMAQWHTWLHDIDVQPGAIMLLPRTRDAARRDILALQEQALVPLLVAANLESGTGSFILGDDAFANPMQVAATGDPVHAHRLGLHCARAAHELGVNWAFAPVADVAINPRNPITNVRAFSDDTELVASMVEQYVSTVEGLGVATSPKHFPGDGVDDRDQHLVTTNNDLSLDDWTRSVEPVWRRIIDAGARTIMVGHIRMPALSRALVPGIAPDQIMPATLAPELLTGVLRERLGFRGLIVTDNTAMAGMTSVMDRRRALPRAIESGCDMLLGNVDVAEDFAILEDALERGDLTLDRVTDAARKVLSTKASIGLHRSPVTVVIPDPVEERQWRDELAAAAVTLVKDTQSLLPLSADQHRRVLVHAIGDVPTFYDPSAGLVAHFARALESRGLNVTVRTVPSDDMTPQSARTLPEDYDLCIYFASVRTPANTNTIRVVWSGPQGPDAPRLSRTELPQLLVSIASPYVLEDMPSVGTAVNGYTPTESTVDACVAALFGDAPFVGRNPVDPFAGRWDAAL